MKTFFSNNHCFIKLEACIGFAKTLLISCHSNQYLVYSCSLNIVRGDWGRLCCLGNKIEKVFQCVLSCCICVPNSIEFERIIPDLCPVLYSIKLHTQLVTSQILLNQQFIFCTFLQITSQPKEIV